MSDPTTRETTADEAALYIQDVTLRDSMHATRNRITPEDVARVASALDAAGIDAIEVTHGDGLAGHSFTFGPGSNTDWKWIEAATSVVHRAKLATLILPGVGTIKELVRAHSMGVRVATHCTQADVAAQHIGKGPRARYGRIGIPDDVPSCPARQAGPVSAPDGISMVRSVFT